jgi:hypothetical protein
MFLLFVGATDDNHRLAGKRNPEQAGSSKE